MTTARVIAICGHEWGIGLNISADGELQHYGYPNTDNPHRFYPDAECCSDAEINAWRKAKGNES